LAAGRDARRVGEAVLARLRVGFLALLAPDLRIDERDSLAEEHARQLGAAGITRALEVVGDAVTSMKEAVDARVALETALVRVARTDLDVAPSALLERIDRLERGLANAPKPEPLDARGVVAPAPAPAAAPTRTAPRPPLRMEKASSPKVESASASVAAPAAAPAPVRDRSADGPAPDREALTIAWGDVILDQISARAKALFRGGRWVDAPTPTFALPTEIHRKRCDEVRVAVQETLSAHFGTSITLTLVVDGSTLTKPAPKGSPPATVDAPDDVVEDVGPMDELDDAPPVASGAARLLEAFPGAVEEP
jgi:hypothetical protein